ncbi:hypothetical protein D9M69_450930 [compost metagenome]
MPVQSKADRQVGGIALARQSVQAALQFLHQPLRLLPVAGGLGSLLFQAAAFAVEGVLDALVDRTLAGTQALVLRLVLAVVAQRGLQLGAELLDLRDQGGDGIARGVARDAERLHLLGSELPGDVRLARCGVAAREQPGTDEHQQQCHRNQQPLQQGITPHRTSSPQRRPAAGSCRHRWG